MDRVHILVIRDFERRKTHVFRRNDVMDDIEDGLDLLESAEVVVGHNIIGFDIPALDKVYTGINIQGRIFDTLPMSRMVFANQKEKDFRLVEKGKLPGTLIGAHGLEAWGHRFGLHKGDYSKMMEEKAKELGITDPVEIAAFIWAKWSQEMEDYAMLDVDITTLLYASIEKTEWSREAIVMEHEIHELMHVQEVNGICFNVEAAQELAQELFEEATKLRDRTIEHFGHWWVPAKKKIIRPLWDDPDGINKAKKYETPAAWLGEDKSRAVWGEVTFPKKSRTIRKDRLCPTTYSTDAPYCKVELKEFNPGSRQQVVDRLVTVHQWHPVDFTEKGQPEVSDSVLRKLPHIPMALELAELFYYNKRLGQLLTGPTAWLKKVDPDGLIHAYVNTGGTVTGRASHVSPNLAQVPKVKHKKGSDGKSYIAKGRDGDHGYECRSLFGVPDDWTLTGADLSGIELRCFAEQLTKYDKGTYRDVLLSGDIHTYNQKLAELPTRDNAKTFIYACVPMDTQALTRRGWKTYSELEEGEDVLTYNSATKRKEWKPLLEKVYYEDAEVIELKNDQTFSVRCTPNHRWFTWKRTRANGYRNDPIYSVVEARNLKTEHNIIVNAPMEESADIDSVGQLDCHHTPKYDTDWTAQVLNMTHNERKAWLSGFCVADGHHLTTGPNKKTWCWTWSQNTGEIADAAIVASYLVWDGRLILNDRTNSANQRKMVIGRETARDYVTCQKIQKVSHPNQPVWCIKTENESWVMRQGNTITITGNTLYGAGDIKIGSIVEPLADEEEQRSIGKKLRDRFMKNMPAFARVVQDMKSASSRGFLIGLDGRKLFVRSPHAVLNTKLQSDAALIAKKWVIMTRDDLEDAGLVQGWLGTFVNLLWIHDEQQIGSRGRNLANFIEETAVNAAAKAGKFFGYDCPIAAEAKSGRTWADTH